LRRDVACRACGADDWSGNPEKKLVCRPCNSRRASKWRKDHPGYGKKYKQSSEMVRADRAKDITRHRVYAYRSWDKRNGFKTETIDMDFARHLMSGPCVYCKTVPANGLDRVHSDRGHVVGNCLGCCEKCNFILGDLPFGAKHRLREGLREINRLGLLDSWEIPTKRKR
jgi:hypothetical protein